jgi:hypothetical protein
VITDTERDTILAALPTAPVPPDPAPLQDLGARITRTIEQGIDDPASIYFKRRDLLEQADVSNRVAYARAGLAPHTRPTPEDLAAAAHARSFAHEPAPALVEMVSDRLAALAALGEREVTRAADDLRGQLGASRYKDLCEDARAAFPPGEDIPAALFADLPALELTAARGRFAKARAATAPKRRL